MIIVRSEFMAFLSTCQQSRFLHNQVATTRFLLSSRQQVHSTTAIRKTIETVKSFMSC